jgi:hypothetical protein
LAAVAFEPATEKKYVPQPISKLPLPVIELLEEVPKVPSLVSFSSDFEERDLTTGLREVTVGALAILHAAGVGSLEDVAEGDIVVGVAAVGDTAEAVASSVKGALVRARGGGCAVRCGACADEREEGCGHDEDGRGMHI